MGRGKVKLELVEKEKSRRLTFEKRKAGLLKKAEEFSILCGVDTAVIICGTPAISDQPDVPEIWPPNPDEVARIIDRYCKEDPSSRAKNAVGLPEVFRSRKRKLDSELVKAAMAACRKKYHVPEGPFTDFTDVHELLSIHDRLGHRLESLKKQHAAVKAKEATLQAVNHIGATMAGSYHHQPTHCFDVQPIPNMLPTLPSGYMPALAPPFDSTQFRPFSQVHHPDSAQCGVHYPFLGGNGHHHLYSDPADLTPFGHLSQVPHYPFLGSHQLCSDQPLNCQSFGSVGFGNSNFSPSLAMQPVMEFQGELHQIDQLGIANMRQPAADTLPGQMMHAGLPTF